jgi:hypothetical protein
MINVGCHGSDASRAESTRPSRHHRIGSPLGDDAEEVLRSIAVLPSARRQIADGGAGQPFGERPVATALGAMTAHATIEEDLMSLHEQGVGSDRPGRRIGNRPHCQEDCCGDQYQAEHDVGNGLRCTIRPDCRCFVRHALWLTWIRRDVAEATSISRPLRQLTAELFRRLESDKPGTHGSKKANCTENDPGGSGAEGDRTLNLRIANAMLSQLSYRPIDFEKY